MKIKLPPLSDKLRERLQTKRDEIATALSGIDKAKATLAELEKRAAGLEPEIASLESSLAPDDETGFQKLSLLKSKLAVTRKQMEKAAEGAEDNEDTWRRVFKDAQLLLAEAQTPVIEQHIERLTGLLAPYFKERWHARHNGAEQTEFIVEYRGFNTNPFGSVLSAATARRAIRMFDQVLAGEECWQFQGAAKAD